MPPELLPKANGREQISLTVNESFLSPPAGSLLFAAAAVVPFAPSARDRGVAAAALTALTTFAWNIPALHRIELYIEPWNVGSVKTAERTGYEREGLLPSHQVIGGRRRDMLLYAMIRD